MGISMDIMAKVFPFILGILLLFQVVGLCMHGHTYIGSSEAIVYVHVPFTSNAWSKYIVRFPFLSSASFSQEEEDQSVAPATSSTGTFQFAPAAQNVPTGGFAF